MEFSCCLFGWDNGPNRVNGFATHSGGVDG